MQEWAVTGSGLRRAEPLAIHALLWAVHGHLGWEYPGGGLCQRGNACGRPLLTTVAPGSLSATCLMCRHDVQATLAAHGLPLSGMVCMRSWYPNMQHVVASMKPCVQAKRASMHPS